jgi:hypothetical protein
MFVLIPVGETWTTRLTHPVQMEFLCGRCAFRQPAVVIASAVGRAFSPLFLARASSQLASWEEAAAGLEANAQQAIELTSCPQCGHHGPGHAALKRYEMWQGVIAAIVGMLIAVSVGALALVDSDDPGQRVPLLLLGTGAVGLLVFGVVWFVRFQLALRRVTRQVKLGERLPAPLPPKPMVPEELKMPVSPLTYRDLEVQVPEPADGVPCGHCGKRGPPGQEFCPHCLAAIA